MQRLPISTGRLCKRVFTVALKPLHRLTSLPPEPRRSTLHPHPHRPPSPFFFAPSGSVRSRLSKAEKGAGGCLQRCRPVVARASALGYDVGIVLALRFQPTGKHGYALLREARGSSPCFVLRPSRSYIYDSHMPSRVGVHRLLFFSFKCQKTGRHK